MDSRCSWFHCHAVVAIASTVLLAACVSLGEDFRMDGIATLRVGETTSLQARMELGDPPVEITVSDWGKRRAHFGDEADVTIWRYSYGTGTIGFARARFLQVSFDAAGKVSDYYYVSDYSEDESNDSKSADFDLDRVQRSVIKGSTHRSEVSALLGDRFQLVRINKPEVVERRHYGYVAILRGEATGLNARGDRIIHGKSVDIDFDARGIVIDIRGESDFPADVKRAR